MYTKPYSTSRWMAAAQAKELDVSQGRLLYMLELNEARSALSWEHEASRYSYVSEEAYEASYGAISDEIEQLEKYPGELRHLLQR